MCPRTEHGEPRADDYTGRTRAVRREVESKGPADVAVAPRVAGPETRALARPLDPPLPLGPRRPTVEDEVAQRPPPTTPAPTGPVGGAVGVVVTRCLDEGVDGVPTDRPGVGVGLEVGPGRPLTTPGDGGPVLGRGHSGVAASMSVVVYYRPNSR